MAASTLVDRVKISVLSSGTGSFQLGAALPAYRGREALVDGATYSYATESGSLYEVGTGVYVSSSGLLVRSPTISSNGGAAVNFPANVEIAFTALAVDIEGGGSSPIPVVQSPGTSTAAVMSQNAVTGALSAILETIAQFSTTAGATFIGWIASGAGGVSRTVSAKLLDTNQTLTDRGGVADWNGTTGTDNRAALLACDAIGATRIPNGSYRIAGGAPLTLTKSLIFGPTATVIVDGIVLAIPAGVISESPKNQIFVCINGGSVVRLPFVEGRWFLGNALTDYSVLPSVTSSATLQLAVNATGYGGRFSMRNAGRLLVDGGSLTAVGDFDLDCEGTQFEWSGAATNGFVLSPTVNPRYAHVGSWTWHVPGTIATSGIALQINRSQSTVRGFANRPFDGWIAAGGASNFYDKFYLYGCFNTGLQKLTIDQFPSNGVINAATDIVQLSSVTGTFNVGDAISISGSVGNIVEAYSAYPNRYGMFFNDAEPTNGIGITDTTTGATATIQNVWIGHQGGGLRSFCAPPSGGTIVAVEAVVEDNIDVIGGLFSMTVDGSGSPRSRTSNPAFNRLGDGLFLDSSYRGTLINLAYGWLLTCWAANSRGKDKPGITLLNCSRIRLSVQCVANSGPGVYWDDSSTHIELVDHDFDGNCRNVSTTVGMGEVTVLGPATRWKILGGWLGWPGANGTTPVRGLFTGFSNGAAAASAGFKLIGVDAPNGALSVNTTTSDYRIVASGNLADH